MGQLLIRYYELQLLIKYYELQLLFKYYELQLLFKYYELQLLMTRWPSHTPQHTKRKEWSLWIQGPLNALNVLKQAMHMQLQHRCRGPMQDSRVHLLPDLDFFFFFFFLSLMRRKSFGFLSLSLSLSFTSTGDTKADILRQSSVRKTRDNAKVAPFSFPQWSMSTLLVKSQHVYLIKRWGHHLPLFIEIPGYFLISHASYTPTSRPLFSPSSDLHPFLSSWFSLLFSLCSALCCWPWVVTAGGADVRRPADFTSPRGDGGTT